MEVYEHLLYQYDYLIKLLRQSSYKKIISNTKSI